MFIDEKTNTKIYADLDSTVIRATHRTQDLIPAFLGVIKDTAEYAQLMVNNFIPSYVFEDDNADWWEYDDTQHFLNETLFDILNGYAPEGYCFGAHQGDGSDFAFWKMEDDQW